MRLKHIYFTKEGEPMANPEMEYPTFNAWRDSQEVEEQAKAKYHSGLLPFEDREKIKEILRVEKIMDAFENGKLQKLIDNKFDKLKSDTLIHVDLEVEVVDQTREIGEEKWNDGNYDNTIFKYHRKVLRIKP